jgi:hypothetical protein
VLVQLVLSGRTAGVLVQLVLSGRRRSLSRSFARDALPSSRAGIHRLGDECLAEVDPVG